MELGHALAGEFTHRKAHFRHYNCGSFGIAPQTVLREAARHRDAWMAQPDEWWEDQLRNEYLRNVDQVALALFGCQTTNGTAEGRQFALVDNTTTGINIIAHSITPTIQKGDVIVAQTTTYPAVLKTLAHHLEAVGAKVELVKLPFPCHSKQELLDAWKAGLSDIQSSGSRIRLILIDHIISENSLLVPLMEMIAIARRFNPIEILIDGAHAPGSVALRGKLDEWNVDYYVGNLHKWCFAPTSVAVMMSQSKTTLHHPLVSHAFSQGIVEECGMLGTRDYSSIVSAGKAVSFLEQLGMDNVHAHLHKLAWNVGTMLSAKWNTEVGQSEEFVAGMISVRLPADLCRKNADLPKQMRKILRHGHNMEIQNPFLVDGQWWLRISCPCFLALQDFVPLADAVQTMY